MPDPLVSIVIPTCARPRLLHRAITSALCQSYRHVEVIVIDDSSRREGLEVCQTIQDERLRSYPNRRTKGACGSRNTGIELARGTFYTGLDDDDYFHRERVLTLMNAYQREYSFVASNMMQLRNDSTSPRFRGQMVVHLSDILWGNCVGNQILTETYKVREVGAFDESLAAGQDFDLWIRMIARWGSALRLAQCLYTMDLGHGGGRIGTTVDIARRVSDILDRHGGKLSTAQRLLYSLRKRRHGGMSYLGYVAISLCYPGTWRYWSKRLSRVW